MFKNWKRSMDTPKPAMAPVAKIVYSKNRRPLKATRKPKIIAEMPKITGFSTKNWEKLETEITVQAFG